VREALRVSAQNFIDSFHDQVSVFVTSSRDNRKSVPQREDRIQGEFECTFNVLLGKHGTRPVVATWVICDVTRSGDAPGNDPTSMLRLIPVLLESRSQTLGLKRHFVLLFMLVVY